MTTSRFDEQVDPELLPALEVYRLLGFETTDFTPDNLDRMRATLTEFMAAAQAELPDFPGVASEDRVVAGPDGDDVPVRVYRPVESDADALPGMYFVHGGGMVLGDLDGSDPGCKAYVDALGCVVVSVDYRLAPEHPHPAPVEDCYAGLAWMAEHADELGVDPARIAVTGASAGGGLAAATCLLARDRGGPEVAYQCLVYPMLDDRSDTASAAEFGGILSWSNEHNASGWGALLGDAVGGDDVSPYAAPARATEPAGLPPTLVQVGDLEVFRDEDVDYATRLMQAGVPTELHVYPGAFHAAEGFAPEADHSVRFMRDQLAALSRAFDTGNDRDR